MSIGSALLGLAILIIVALFLVRPFFRDRQQPAQLSRRQQLENQKEALLLQIHALDFDRETSKIPEDVYEAQRGSLMEQAAAILKEIDQLPAETGQDITAQIEAAIAELRRQQTAPSNGKVAYCTKCGRQLDAHDNFCAGCGHPVPVAQPTG